MDGQASIRILIRRFHRERRSLDLSRQINVGDLEFLAIACFREQIADTISAPFTWYGSAELELLSYNLDTGFQD